MSMRKISRTVGRRLWSERGFGKDTGLLLDTNLTPGALRDNTSANADAESSPGDSSLAALARLLASPSSFLPWLLQELPVFPALALVSSALAWWSSNMELWVVVLLRII